KRTRNERIRRMVYKRMGVDGTRIRITYKVHCTGSGRENGSGDYAVVRHAIERTTVKYGVVNRWRGAPALWGADDVTLTRIHERIARKIYVKPGNSIEPDILIGQRSRRNPYKSLWKQRRRPIGIVEHADWRCVALIRNVAHTFV